MKRKKRIRLAIFHALIDMICCAFRCRWMCCEPRELRRVR